MDCIASEDTDGKFYLSENDCILCRVPGESEPWYVYSSLSRLWDSVQAFENYVVEAIDKETEEER
jgi:hypothetical protein